MPDTCPYCDAECTQDYTPPAYSYPVKSKRFACATVTYDHKGDERSPACHKGEVRHLRAQLAPAKAVIAKLNDASERDRLAWIAVDKGRLRIADAHLKLADDAIREACKLAEAANKDAQ